MKSDFRSYAELVLKTQGARAVSYLGDFSRAIDVLRGAAVTFLKQLPGTDRAAIARILGVSLRTVDDWNRLAREQASYEEGKGEPPPTTREFRIYVATVGLLEDARGRYLSLGQIVDHIKATVDRRLSTMEIWKRLESYVSLKILEHDPSDEEAYRLAVRPPVVVDRDPAFIKQLLEVIMPASFDIGYQLYAGVTTAHGRIEVFDIPEEREKAFGEAVARAIVRMSDELNEVERKFRAECPGTPRKKYKVVNIAGPNDLDTSIPGADDSH